MKRYILVQILLVMCCIGYGQNVKRIFKDFKNKPQVEYVNALEQLRNSGKEKLSDSDVDNLKNITSVEVLLLKDDATDDVKEVFFNQMKEIKLKGFETIMSVNKSGSHINVFAKTRKKSIREVLVTVAGGGKNLMVYITGDLQKEDLGKIISMN